MKIDLKLPNKVQYSSYLVLYHNESYADTDAAQNIRLIADGVNRSVQTARQIRVRRIGIALTLLGSL